MHQGALNPAVPVVAARVAGALSHEAVCIPADFGGVFSLGVKMTGEGVKRAVPLDGIHSAFEINYPCSLDLENESLRNRICSMTSCLRDGTKQDWLAKEAHRGLLHMF